MPDETNIGSGRAADPAALVATGERVTLQIAALRADLKAAEERTAARVAAAVVKSAKDLEAENVARRRSQRRTWVTVILDVGLSLVSLTLWHSQSDTSRQLREANRQIQVSLQQNYVTSQQQVQTRRAVLCPLESYLLTLTKLTQRAALPADQQAQYDKAAGLFKDGYATLGCEAP
jgi:hypothetical protein